MDKALLEQWYTREKKSVCVIAEIAGCSQSKVNYWLKKFNIPKRSISEAIYTKRNPQGDPFLFKNHPPFTQSFLFGLGLGLYWGGGTKMNAMSVRLGNTDPHLVRLFLLFLKEMFNIDESRLRFGLQIFRDMDQKKEEKFWQTFLKVPAHQFYKTINTRSGSLGTYRTRSTHGVLTVYFNNKKLRDVLVNEIERLRKFRYTA